MLPGALSGMPNAWSARSASAIGGCGAKPKPKKFKDAVRVEAEGDASLAAARVEEEGDASLAGVEN